MGLLDSLFAQNGGGGLLDFLRNNAMNQQFGSGLQSDQAQYGQQMQPQMPQGQPSPLDNAQWPQGPVGAPSQGAPNAQPTQMPQATNGEGSFATGMRALGNPGGLINKVADAVQGFSGVPTPANQTAQFLVSKGLDPALAKTIVSDPQLLRSVLPQIMGTGGQTDDIKEYQFAKRENPSLTFEKFMQQKRAVSGEFGMQPIWGMKDGKPSIVQLGKSGEAKESVLPPGFSPARDPVKVEGPTGTTILDPQTRQIIQFIPKDVAGAAKSKEIGEAEGQATVNLPTAIATAENTLKTIKQLEEHPGKKAWGAFGMGAMLPDIPGTDTRGFGSLVDQVKGQNFMTAFQSLKGAGAITEQEGAKAEKAQARLDRAQSEKDFDIAIKDLKEVVMAGMERARQKAGIKNNQPAPAADDGWKNVGNGISIREKR